MAIPLPQFFSSTSKKQHKSTTITPEHRKLHHIYNSALILFPSDSSRRLILQVLADPLSSQIAPSIRETICSKCGLILEDEIEGTRIGVVSYKGKKGKGITCGNCGSKTFEEMKTVSQKKRTTFASSSTTKEDPLVKKKVPPKKKSEEKYVHKKRKSDIELGFKTEESFIALPPKQKPKTMGGGGKKKKEVSGMDKFLNSLNN